MTMPNILKISYSSENIMLQFCRSALPRFQSVSHNVICGLYESSALLHITSQAAPVSEYEVLKLKYVFWNFFLNTSQNNFFEEEHRNHKRVLVIKQSTCHSCSCLNTTLTLRLPNYIPSVISLILVAGKVFTHNCDTRNLSALIQCWNIVHQIERDGFQRYQTFVQTVG
jgi:hypothetical protein